MGAAGRPFFSSPPFAFEHPDRKMPYTEAERIRMIQEQATKFVSRNKCVDSSLLTMTRQAAASKNINPSAVSQTGCPGQATIRGKGTNMEYVNVLQGAQACAVCPTTAPADGGVVPAIVLPTPCFTPPPSTVVQPCSVPGFNQYFPKAIYDGPGCTYNRITTPS